MVAFININKNLEAWTKMRLNCASHLPDVKQN